MGSPSHRPDDIQTELSRDLGLVSALAIGVGTMIAAGIFTLSGLAIGYVGSAAIVSFLLAAVVASFTALTYCEFSSIYPESGEGYLYARKTFPAPLAYVVGWCLLLGYSSSCGFYIASLSVYFSEFIWHLPIEIISGLVALVALTLLNIKGTKESGTFQVVVTAGKILLLIWFVFGGLGEVDVDHIVESFSTDFVKIGSTSALVFITFFGFSAIAASAGEVKDPTRTIPRAIFISMGVVTVLYSLVVLVVVAARLTEYGEAAMGAAARAFLGPIGGMVIVGGALFSMVSASNASILAASRVALAMSRLGHLPRRIGTINAQTRTPVVALLLVGGAIGAFAAALPLEALAHFADCVLLIALILVNAALIIHRRRYPHLERPFRIPLVPLLPALGIAANVYLLAQLPHIEPLLLAVGAISVGFFAYLAWKGSQVEETVLPGDASRVALEQRATSPSEFRVLVPIANPANVDELIDLASDIAGARNGEIVALRVVVLPEQVEPRLEAGYVEQERQVLERARTRAIDRNVHVTTIIRIGHNPARAILETSRERACDLIVLGWKGHTSTARRILGEVTDDVVNHARVDILLARLAGGETPRRFLLPTAGGEHAVRAENYAAQIAAARDGALTLCTVVAPDAPPERLHSEEERLRKSRERILESSTLKNVDTVVLRDRSVYGAIVAEAEQHEAIVVGAAGQSFSNQVLFGSIPEDLARHSTRPVFVIKRHHVVRALVGRVMSE